MRKRLWFALLASGSAAAATIGVYLDTGAVASSAVTVVTGAPTPSANPVMPSPDTASLPAPAVSCRTIAGSQGSVEAPPGSTRCGLPNHTTLQDRVYFGAFWQILDRQPATAAIAPGGGCGQARVERSSGGDFFAGIVERTNRRAR